jgi:hypothetical protein
MTPRRRPSSDHHRGVGSCVLCLAGVDMTRLVFDRRACCTVTNFVGSHGDLVQTRWLPGCRWLHDMPLQTGACGRQGVDDCMTYLCRKEPVVVRLWMIA